MPRATTKAASLADGPTLASTRDYWILHLRSEGKLERTISTRSARRSTAGSERTGLFMRAVPFADRSARSSQACLSPEDWTSEDPILYLHPAFGGELPPELVALRHRQFDGVRITDTPATRSGIMGRVGFAEPEGED